ncbi:MAG: hypothetical protein GXO55_00290 [Chloroflexi bacterium]|nr:hypothetical protein [Chloroflexota bacterium]
MNTRSTLTKVLGALIAATVVLFLVNLVTGGSKASATGWVLYIVGALIVMAIYFFFANKPIWEVGTREVVMMAIGAVLYGIFSWATNVFQLPSVSFVSLRPAVAIPIFMGLAFGPVVGFFSGAVGNIIGDALTGWGVFPVWDLGNGLMGMIPGLILAWRTWEERRRVTERVLVLVGAILALFVVLTLLFPQVEHPWMEGARAGQWTLGLLIITVVLIAVGWYFLRTRPQVAVAVIWGALGVIVGMGFASLADIWVNGYSLATAIIGEFLPAAASNLVFDIILVPILYSAYEAARSQTGR